MRVFAISDIHIDHPANAEWIFSLAMDYQKDILILAGDITDKRDLLVRCFEHLNRCFFKVLFVPGNHDVWVHRDDLDCSLEKFHAVQRLAHQEGIHIDVFEIDNLSIVPLLGWYDYSFCEPEDQLRTRWMDFFACKWPDDYDEASITTLFTDMNKRVMATKNEQIISFSHFLPRIDVMPPFIPKKHRLVYPVLGSTLLERQIRQLNPDIHIYGHSHVNRITRLDGITYINNAFGTPTETSITNKTLLPVWDSENGMHHA